MILQSGSKTFKSTFTSLNMSHLMGFGLVSKPFAHQCSPVFTGATGLECDADGDQGLSVLLYKTMGENPLHAAIQSPCFGPCSS